MSVDEFKTSYHRRCMFSIGNYWNSNDNLLVFNSKHIFIRVKKLYENFEIIISCFFFINIRFVIHLTIHNSEWLKLSQKERTIKTSFTKRNLITHVKFEKISSAFIYFYCNRLMIVILTQHQIKIIVDN